MSGIDSLSAQYYYNQLIFTTSQVAPSEINKAQSAAVTKKYANLLSYKISQKYNVITILQPRKTHREYC